MTNNKKTRSLSEFFLLLVVQILFEQALGHLLEATAPGEELVGGALGDQTLGIEACGLQRLYALVDAIGILLVTTAFEDILHALGILDVLWHVHATREQTPVGDFFYLGTVPKHDYGS